MKNLVIARHGEQGVLKSLSSRGTEQVGRLVHLLVERGIMGPSSAILSSPEARATESASIIAKYAPGVKVESITILGLCPKPLLDETLPFILELIQERGVSVETLILVTHIPIVDRLPQLFGRTLSRNDFPEEPIPTGKAWVINCERKTCELFPSSTQKPSSRKKGEPNVTRINSQ